LLALGIAFVPLLKAQSQDPLQDSDDSLPSAADIFDHYLNATGGKAAHDRIQNQVTEITRTQDGQFLSHSTLFQTKEGDFRETDITGVATIETGISHGVAWRKTAESAELLEPGEEQSRLLRDAGLLPEGNWRHYFKHVEVETSEMLDGRPCVEVAAKSSIGESLTLFFDLETGLLAKQVVAEPAGLVETRFEDFLDVGEGILMARREVTTMNGVTIVTTVDLVQFNQSIPASTFELPAEVAMLASKKSGL